MYKLNKCRQYDAKWQIDSAGFEVMTFSVPHVFVEKYCQGKYSPAH